MSDHLYRVRCQGQLGGPWGGQCRHWTRVPLHLAMRSTNRCRFCAAVEGAIMQLNKLVADEPWWEIEGRVGDPDYEEVEAYRAEVVAAVLDDMSARREMEEEHQQQTYEGGLSFGLAQELRRQGADLCDRLVLSFIATAGQGLTEAEAYGPPAAEDDTTTTATAAEQQQEEEEEEEEEKKEEEQEQEEHEQEDGKEADDDDDLSLA